MKTLKKLLKLILSDNLLKILASVLCVIVIINYVGYGEQPDNFTILLIIMCFIQTTRPIENNK